MSWLNDSSRRKFSLGTIASPAEPEINLIPFIDVLLVVLIFLMISTTFTRFQELAITLPTANGNESQAEVKQIHIAVSRDGRFAVNGKVADRAQLSALLSQMSNQGTSSKETPNAMQVNIDADARAPHQAVMSALEAARDANLSNIVFSSQTKK
jgi:biopolymer transport protein ExbD